MATCNFANLGACNRACPEAKARFPHVGRLAQLVEHLVYTERVGGSSPSSPTSFKRKRHGALLRMKLPEK
jgi:hypothetical protein